MVKVAIVQASSVPFDSQAAVHKAATLLRDAAEQGADFVLFPEAFVGGYPKGIDFGNLLGNREESGRELFALYADSAVPVGNRDALKELVDTSTASNTTCVIGVIERDGKTLYCTAVTIVPKRGIINVHRKLMPTGLERTVWGFGDGSTIRAVDTPVGRVGSVICWENYMPLLRDAMYAQHLDLYCAPTADDRPTWLASMRHIALEGRVFVLSACQVIRLEEFPDFFQKEYRLESRPEVVMRGGSVIVNPAGEIVAGPIMDKETILTADIDYSFARAQALDFDPVGNYSRPDIFRLQVNTEAQDPVVFGQHEF